MRISPWLAFFLTGLTLASVARAQESQSYLNVKSEDEVEHSGKPWSFDLTAELRATNDERRDRPQTRNRQSLHELSVGGGYRFDSHFSAELELSVEQLHDESTFFVKQAYVKGEAWEERLQVLAGQQFLPIGLTLPREHWFTANPPFMDKLVGGAKPIDLGVVARVQPLGNAWLMIEGGVFSGQMVREQDARLGEPEKAPRVASLKSHSEHHDVFLTYFEHDLAFYDPLRAYGFGGEFRTPQWFGLLKGSVTGEFWQIEQIQRSGPDERTNGYLLVGQVDFWRLAAGYRFSEASARLVTATNSTSLPRENSRLAFVQMQLAPMLLLRAERLIDEQSVVLRDEWAGRLLLHWQL
ncbi:MAG: hypothetical protein KF799_01035 [Bdellovibrionales bacterium]|nr:hypothetical protein [Bdellovibrionales bacterium]